MLVVANGMVFLYIYKLAYKYYKSKSLPITILFYNFLVIILNSLAAFVFIYSYISRSIVLYLFFGLIVIGFFGNSLCQCISMLFVDLDFFLSELLRNYFVFPVSLHIPYSSYFSIIDS
jgi:hypothetical protein